MQKTLRNCSLLLFLSIFAINFYPDLYKKKINNISIKSTISYFLLILFSYFSVLIVLIIHTAHCMTDNV